MPSSYTYSDFHPTFKESISGDIEIKYDVDAVFASLRNIMATVSGERVRNPIGSRLVGLLFEPLSEDTAADVVTELKAIVRQYEPRVLNLRISVRPDFDSLTYDVQIRFNILGLDGSQVMNAPLRVFGDSTNL